MGTAAESSQGLLLPCSSLTNGASVSPWTQRGKKRVPSFAVLNNPHFIESTPAREHRATRSRPKEEESWAPLQGTNTSVWFFPSSWGPSTHHEHGLLVDKGLLLCCQLAGIYSWNHGLGHHHGCGKTTHTSSKSYIPHRA